MTYICTAAAGQYTAMICGGFCSLLHRGVESAPLGSPAANACRLLLQHAKGLWSAAAPV
jgi:hypothetical protein